MERTPYLGVQKRPIGVPAHIASGAKLEFGAAVVGANDVYAGPQQIGSVAELNAAVEAHRAKAAPAEMPVAQVYGAEGVGAAVLAAQTEVA